MFQQRIDQHRFSTGISILQPGSHLLQRWNPADDVQIHTTAPFFVRSRCRWLDAIVRPRLRDLPINEFKGGPFGPGSNNQIGRPQAHPHDEDEDEAKIDERARHGQRSWGTRIVFGRSNVQSHGLSCWQAFQDHVRPQTTTRVPTHLVRPIPPFPHGIEEILPETRVRWLHEGRIAVQDS